MLNLAHITLDTPSSSGESELALQSDHQRKKKKPVKISSAKSCSQIPRLLSIKSPEKLNQSSQQILERSLSIPRKYPSPFFVRKSLSLMDLKYCKRDYNRFMGGDLNNSCNMIVTQIPGLSPSSQTSNSFGRYDVHNTSRPLEYILSEPEMGCESVREAGKKVLTTLMLNSWRKSRAEVRRLTEDVSDLQLGRIKGKNQIHVLSSLYRSEQKTNEKLTRMISHTNEQIKSMQSTINELSSTLLQIKAEKRELEEQLSGKEKEVESLTQYLSGTTNQLYKALSQVRDLQKALNREHRRILELENNNASLLNEISDFDTRSRSDEEKHLQILYKKDEDLTKANSEIKLLKSLLINLKEAEIEVRDLKKSESKLKTEVDSLQDIIMKLQTELTNSLSNRFKKLWNNYLQVNRNTLSLLHFGAFYLLPGLPAPMGKPINVIFQRARRMIQDKTE